MSNETILGYMFLFIVGAIYIPCGIVWYFTEQIRKESEKYRKDRYALVKQLREKGVSISDVIKFRNKGRK